MPKIAKENSRSTTKKWHNEFRMFMQESKRHWKDQYPVFRSHTDGDKLAGYKLVEGIVKIPHRYLKLDTVSELTPYMIKKIPSDRFVVKALLGNQGKRVICLHRKLISGELMYKDILRDRKYGRSLENVTQYIKQTLIRNEGTKGSALIIEQFLGDPEVGLPMDYKLYTVNGKVRMISLFTKRLSDTRSDYIEEYTNTFDKHWNPIPLNKMYKNPEELEYIEKAIELEPVPPKRARNKLVEIAEELAYKHDAIFCRYDFYCVKEDGEYNIYFGEITPVCGDLNRYELLRTPLELLYPST